MDLNLQRLVARVGMLALACCTSPSFAEPVTLPAGMLVELELQHHVNSAYIHVGTPIYFRVAKDVSINNHVLISKGTLVTGTMEQANARGMVGRSGSMSLGVRLATAVDGTNVPVDADLSSQGRSRAGATVAWTLFWGVPGLITRGVNPYLERGALIDAKVVNDIAIDPARAATSAGALVETPAQVEVRVIGTKVAGFALKKALEFDIERNRDLKMIEFKLEPPTGLEDPAAALRTLELISFDGVAVPERVQAVSATEKSVSFDGWSIVRFCKEGVTTLHFAGVAPDGQRLAGEYQMLVKIKKKG